MSFSWLYGDDFKICNMLYSDCSYGCQLLELKLAVCHTYSNTGTENPYCDVHWHVLIEQHLPSSDQGVHSIFILISKTSLANENTDYLFTLVHNKVYMTTLLQIPSQDTWIHIECLMTN